MLPEWMAWAAWVIWIAFLLFLHRQNRLGHEAKSDRIANEE
jgi:hypothetical protein